MNRKNNYSKLNINQKINSKSWMEGNIMAQTIAEGMIFCIGGYSEPNLKTK